MGEFLKPVKVNGITAAWVDKTALYMSNIEDLLLKTWKKILVAARKLVEKKGTLRPVAQADKLSLCCQIIDADDSDWMAWSLDSG
jgi:hypothetical protein